jgi:glycosyltransferase involved in cell wall biosynthesis
LEKIIEKYNLENRVFLVGFLENAKEYLKAFDIFTLTSIKEGLPYTILEAGLAGLPIIASNVGGVPDIIDNGINGILVEKTNVGQISKTIEFMIKNPDQRKSFGLKLQQKIEKEFSLKQMLDKTLQLYGK